MKQLNWVSAECLKRSSPSAPILAKSPASPLSLSLSIYLSLSLSLSLSLTPVRMSSRHKWTSLTKLPLDPKCQRVHIHQPLDSACWAEAACPHKASIVYCDQLRFAQPGVPTYEFLKLYKYGALIHVFAAVACYNNTGGLSGGIWDGSGPAVVSLVLRVLASGLRVAAVGVISALQQSWTFTCSQKSNAEQHLESRSMTSRALNIRKQFLET